jgi:hypothetical protein
MENAHSRQKETTRSFVQTNVLDHWKKIKVIALKQTPTIQNNTKTDMDLRNSPLGHSLSLQNLNFTTLPKQSSKDNN